MPRGAQFGIVVIAFFMVACSSPAYAGIPATTAVTATVPPPPTLTSTPTPTPTPTQTPTQTPTSTLSPTPACHDFRGKVASDEIDSLTLGKAIPFRIYLPPCYHAQTQSYPVLYLIHGLNMDESAWDELGIDEVADALIASDDLPPFIIVMPRAPDDSRFADSVALELLPFIDSHYRTLPDRDHRAVGGMSRGGGWAVRIGFQHPEPFGAMGLHSVAVFYADENKVHRWIADVPDELAPRIYIDIGESDPLIDNSARWLDETLTARGFAHEFHVRPGGHTSGYWAKHLPEYLRWYTGAWQP